MTDPQASVLFVDDEPAVLDAIVRCLHREPYRLFRAGDADQALQRLHTDRIDIVVSDLSMPGMGGLELLRHIRLQWPDTVRCVLSGHATLNDALRAINEGEIHRFLLKPCPREELLQALSQCLRHQRLMEVANRLLRQCKQQIRLLRALEQDQPGITDIQRDDSGAIVLDDLPDDLDGLLR